MNLSSNTKANAKANKKERKIYLSLGSNLPFEMLSSPQIIEAALEQLSSNGISIIKKSRLIYSKAWPLGSQAPDYANIVVQIDFDGENEIDSAFTLLTVLQMIEANFNRQRDSINRWAPRTLDIDIIDFNGLCIDEIRNSTHLILPHPRLHLRDFVLLPLEEIAPNWRNPQTKKTVAALIAQLTANNDLNT